MNTVLCGCIWVMNSVELLRKIGVECSVSKEITSIVRYHTLCDEHSIYVDVSKRRSDEYVQIALDKGALVLSEHSIADCIYVDDASVVFGELLQVFYGFPYRKLKLIGVTGTCGKSTVVSLLYSCLKDQGLKSCCVMSGKVILDDEVIETHNTTPDSSFLIPLMHECVQKGIQYLMMEVSSEAYVNHRVEGLYFDVMIGTVMAKDHLDTHHTVKNYLKIKKQILSMIKPEGVVILNHDDPVQRNWMNEMDEMVLTYGTCGNFAFSDCVESLDKTVFQFDHHKIEMNLLSMANVYNVCSVFGCAFVLDLVMDRVYKWIEQVVPVSGRFEIIHQNPLIMIDYAHTEKAVKTVLEFLRRCTDRKIICVFGCGGNRDKLKRPLMGKAVCDYSDTVIVSSDNPRDENPDQIIQDILKGCTKEVVVEKDRKKAIQFALETCSKNDIIILLGKGDEKSVFSCGKMINTSEKEMIQCLMKEKYV